MNFFDLSHLTVHKKTGRARSPNQGPPCETGILLLVDFQFLMMPISSARARMDSSLVSSSTSSLRACACATMESS